MFPWNFRVRYSAELVEVVCDIKFLESHTGAVESGVQGVKLHTHFLAHMFGKDQVLSQKFLIYSKSCTPTI